MTPTHLEVLKTFFLSPSCPRVVLSLCGPRILTMLADKKGQSTLLAAGIDIASSRQMVAEASQFEYRGAGSFTYAYYWLKVYLYRTSGEWKPRTLGRPTETSDPRSLCQSAGGESAHVGHRTMLKAHHTIKLLKSIMVGTQRFGKLRGDGELQTRCHVHFDDASLPKHTSTPAHLPSRHLTTNPRGHGQPTVV